MWAFIAGMCVGAIVLGAIATVVVGRRGDDVREAVAAERFKRNAAVREARRDGWPS